MPKYALMTPDSAFSAVREVDGPVATHKLVSDGGAMLRPYVSVSRPDVVDALQTCTLSHDITSEQVTEVWTVTRRPLDAQKQAVKDESGVRIYTPYPQWKQANMQALGLSLIDKKLAGQLSTQEQAALDALYAVWGWIMQVRAASDALEVMNPIPLDYTDDSHWPSDPPPAPTV